MSFIPLLDTCVSDDYGVFCKDIFIYSRNSKDIKKKKKNSL